MPEPTSHFLSSLLLRKESPKVIRNKPQKPGIARQFAASPVTLYIRLPTCPRRMPTTEENMHPAKGSTNNNMIRLFFVCEAGRLMMIFSFEWISV